MVNLVNPEFSASIFTSSVNPVLGEPTYIKSSSDQKAFMVFPVSSYEVRVAVPLADAVITRVLYTISVLSLSVFSVSCSVSSGVFTISISSLHDENNIEPKANNKRNLLYLVIIV